MPSFTEKPLEKVASNRSLFLTNRPVAKYLLFPATSFIRSLQVKQASGGGKIDMDGIVQSLADPLVMLDVAGERPS
jgi:hypothetical protein